MKRITHLIPLLALMLSINYSYANTINVTNNSTSADTQGSFLYSIANTSSGDTILFNMDGDTIKIAAQCNFPVNKTIVVDGLNIKTGNRVVFKPTDEYVGRGFEISTLNQAGVITFADVTFHRCVFTGFRLSAIRNNGVLTLESCLFKDNGVTKSNGGAMFVNTPCIIRNCIFDGNKSIGESRGGGAIYAGKIGARIEIESSTFINNETDNQGGVMWIADGTVVKISNSTFVNNKATKAESKPEGGKGGVIAATIINDHTDPSRPAPAIYITNSTFTGNNAQNGAGAIHMIAGINMMNIWVANSIVAYNNNGTDYNDIAEENKTSTIGTIKPLNVIYGNANSEFTARATTETGCQKVDYTTGTVLFRETETIAGTTLKRPVIETVNNLPVALLAANSIAIAKGTNAIPESWGNTETMPIPTADQLGNARPNTPSVGAVEFIEPNSVWKPTEKRPQVWMEDHTLYVKGLDSPVKVEVYNPNGQLFTSFIQHNDGSLPLKGFSNQLMIIRLTNSQLSETYKTFSK